MPSFRVLLNGSHHATLSLPSLGVLNCIVGWVDRSDRAGPLRQELKLDVGGLDTIRDEFLEWPRCDLQVGDVVTIEILDSIEGSPEAFRRPVAQAVNLDEKEKDWVRTAAKKLGWKIIER